jgi:hemoglobin
MAPICPILQNGEIRGNNIYWMSEQEVYSVVGESGFEKLVAGFYRQVPNDDILGPLYRGIDLAGAEERLREFLIFRFGGPERYIAERGHPRLRMRHAPFAITEAARSRWLRLMASALAETEMPVEAKEVLWAYFESTATAMINA